MSPDPPESGSKQRGGPQTACARSRSMSHQVQAILVPDMSERLSPSTAQRTNTTSETQQERDALRPLSRSPHPYHRHKSELLEPSGRFLALSTARPLFPSGVDDSQPRNRLSFPAVSRDGTPSSDSGTEADDEHFLKGLPAPKTRLHKGLRGRDEVLSGTSTPLPSSVTPEDGGRRTSYITSLPQKQTKTGNDQQFSTDSSKRNKVVIRRLTELVLLGSLGALVHANNQVRPVIHRWRFGRSLFNIYNISRLLIIY